MNDKFTNKQKKEISNIIKPITKEDVITEFNKLKQIDLEKVKPLSRLGNNIVDYFTFTERLNTKGRRSISYFELLTNIADFENKGSYKKMLDYIEETITKNEYIKVHRLFQMYFGTINVFKPLRAMEIYAKYKPNSVLDFTMGWGGRLVGACALNVPNYIGIDLNKNLQKPYKDMVNTLKHHTQTNIQLLFQDCLKVDYSKLDYDMVFTSPPYYNIEIYNGTKRMSKQEWDEKFYIPIIILTHQHLRKGGHYILNVSKEIYERVCINILGEADEVIPLTLQQRGTTKYKEFIYVWKKIE